MSRQIHQGWAKSFLPDSTCEEYPVVLSLQIPENQQTRAQAHRYCSGHSCQQLQGCRLQCDVGLHCLQRALAVFPRVSVSPSFSTQVSEEPKLTLSTALKPNEGRWVLLTQRQQESRVSKGSSVTPQAKRGCNSHCDPEQTVGHQVPSATRGRKVSLQRSEAENCALTPFVDGSSWRAAAL